MSRYPDWTACADATLRAIEDERDPDGAPMRRLAEAVEAVEPRVSLRARVARLFRKDVS